MIIVQAKATPKYEESRKKIVDFAQNLIENSKEEEGNIDYNLLINTADDTLLFVEEWETIEIFKKHLETKHFLQFSENIKNLVSGELEIKIYNSKSISL